MKREIYSSRMPGGLQSFRGLLQMAVKPSLGPSPSFEAAHMILAFLTIGESRTIGRQALAVRSGLKEGPVRTVLKKLREGEYVDTNASGCHLTKTGGKVFESLKARLSPLASIQGSKLTMGRFQASLAVRGGGRSVKSGLEQRDAAIALGAAGATTFVIRDGKFTIPGGSADCERDFPGRSWKALRGLLFAGDGDVVILSGADDETTAKLGALSAALTIL